MNRVKNSLIGLSLAAIVALTPTVSNAAQAGFVGGSSESTSALIEPANVEKQLNRVNDGINLIRVNQIVLYDLPISQTATWPDEIAKELTVDLKKKVDNTEQVQSDPYYSTVAISNAFMGNRNAAIVSAIAPLTPMAYHLHYRLINIFQEVKDKKGNSKNPPKYNIPDLYSMPSLSNLSTYINFPEDKKGNLKEGKLIKVNAEGGSGLFKNVTEATIELVPKSLQKSIKRAAEEMQKKERIYLDFKSELGELEAWLKDDKNANSAEKAAKEEKIAVVKKEAEDAEKIADEASDAYYKTLEEGALAVETNFDSSKVELAKKLEKVFDSIDDAAIGATSLFGAATVHITKNGIGTLSQELQAIALAEAAVKVLTQKNYLGQRYKRMGINAIYLLPNIGIGSYYAYKQIKLAGKYQAIVDAVLDGAKAQEEAEKAAAEAKAEAEITAKTEAEKK